MPMPAKIIELGSGTGATVNSVIKPPMIFTVASTAFKVTALDASDS